MRVDMDTTLFWVLASVVTAMSSPSTQNWTQTTDASTATTPSGYDTTAHQITGLEPYTDYNVTVLATTVTGYSQLSNEASVRTKAAVPTSPTDVTATAVNAKAIQVTWSKPKVYPGPTNYTVNVSLKEGDGRAVKMEVVQGYDTTSQQITGLQPFTEYNVIVFAITVRGSSEPSHYASVRTKAGMFVTATAMNASVIEVTWTLSGPDPALTNYTLRVTKPPTGQVVQVIKIQGYNNASHQVTGLKPYTEYCVTVLANTDNGTSGQSQVTVKTNASAPGQVEGFDIQPVNGSVTKVTAVWSCPTLTNRHGYMDSFRIEQTAQESQRQDVNATTVEGNVTFKPAATNANKTCDEQYSQILPIIPEVMYIFKIQAKVKDVEEFGEVLNRVYMSPPGVPPALNKTAVVDPQVPESQRQTTSFKVIICATCLLDGTYGQVISFGVIVCVDTFCDQGKSLQYGSKTVQVRDLKTWRAAKVESFHVPYVIMNKAWEEQLREGGQQKVEIQVGTDASCETLPSTSYCNGPLPSGKNFRVIVYTCTRAGCSTSDSIGPFSTAASASASEDKNILVPAIAGGAGGALVILILLAIFIIRRRRSMKEKGNACPTTSVGTDGGVDDELSPGVILVLEERPIRISEFKNQLSIFQEHDHSLCYHEFQELIRLSPAHPCEVALNSVNKSKSGWTNILPFDHSRVTLWKDPNIPEETDYINANFIPGVNSPKEYIAAQGPSTPTIPQFWTMVWQQNVCVIVMLSDFQEADPRTNAMRQIVAQYFQDEDEYYCGETLLVTQTGKTSNSLWDCRTLKLVNVKEKNRRMVKHFLLKNWTDHTVDVLPARLLDFVADVREETNQNPKAPLLVHCSTGVGKSGVFLAVDYFNNLFNALPPGMTKAAFLQTSVDIFGHVLLMRNYRKMMVQTTVQYQFMYQVVDELIRRKLMTLESENIYSQVVDPEEDDSRRPSKTTDYYNVPKGRQIRSETDANRESYELRTDYENVGDDSQSDEREKRMQTHKF